MEPVENSDQESNAINGLADSITEESMLSPLEARILGSLMEKQLTTPDGYPLSLNSLVLACNQKTSREPVMQLNNGDVQHCLYELQDRELIEIEYASRADKYKQRLTRALHFDKAKHAIFSLMLLRGPQTVNELFSRSKRMYDFERVAEVEELLTSLLEKLKPQICKIPHLPGQREDRFTHLLCGKPDITATPTNDSGRVSKTYTDELTIRVEELEKQVAWLMEKINS